MRRYSALTALLLFAAIAMGIGTQRASNIARAAAATATPTGSSLELIRSYPLSKLEADAVTFSRITLARGETYHLVSSSDTRAIYIDSGNWTFDAAESDQVFASGSNAALPPTKGPAAVSADELVIETAGEASDLTNVGNDQAVAMIFDFIAQPGASATPSASAAPVSDSIQLPPGSIDMTISRITISKDVTTDSIDAVGPQFISTESGTLIVAINPGHLHILRATGSKELVTVGHYDPAAEPTLDPNDSEQLEEIEAREDRTIEPLVGASAGLAAGDTGGLEAGSSYVMRGGSDAPASAIVIGFTLSTPQPATPSS